MQEEKRYIAIDLKSFYASVECVERELDPLRTNLVVADISRTEKTICLAVSPALKAYGIPGRARLFEVIQRVGEINAARRLRWKGPMTGRSSDAGELEKHPDWELDFITAPPRMSHYMEFSARIYGIYLKYIAPEDIHVYSIDEVFIDAAPYLRTYRMNVREFAEKLIREVMDTTGITATAGIGSNLYLCKVAMDIVAKHVEADSTGLRIAELDTLRYREQLWDHRPLTDFWRIGRGIAQRLERYGMYTMGDVARCSLGKAGDWHNEELLYKLFGVNAELLIDHAWGYEPCTMADIHAYRPQSSSLSSGQVLTEPYTKAKAGVVIREMADALALDLCSKGLLTRQITVSVGYDVSNLSDPAAAAAYRGQVHTDMYGRKVPRHAHGTANLSYTCSSRQIARAAGELYERIADPQLLVRRLNICAGFLVSEDAVQEAGACRQMDMFSDPQQQEEEQKAQEREIHRQRTILQLKHRFGKNAVLRGTDLEEGATAIARNGQIGGHRA